MNSHISIVNMKLPKQAKKVFSGVIFGAYQWEQELFDGSTATFEMLKRPNTLQVIPVLNGKIIMARESQPTKTMTYTLLGGRQEPNETPEAGIKRELLEEAGLASADWQFYKSFEPLHKLDWTIYYFIARDCKKIQEPLLEPGEKIELIPVDFEEFVEILLSDNFWGGDFPLHVAKLKLRNQLDELRNFIFKT